MTLPIVQSGLRVVTGKEHSRQEARVFVINFSVAFVTFFLLRQVLAKHLTGKNIDIREIAIVSVIYAITKVLQIALMTRFA